VKQIFDKEDFAVCVEMGFVVLVVREGCL